MNKNLKDAKGFTIIEVLIVLAIAGLIMLVVFLAVPSLQRNQRNSARTSDASLLAAAINECLSNRNGQAASCDTNAELNLDLTKFNQLTTIAPNTAMPATTITNTAHYAFNRKCQADGSAATTTGATPRSFAIQYRTETATGDSPRCLEA